VCVDRPARSRRRRKADREVRPTEGVIRGSARKLHRGKLEYACAGGQWGLLGFCRRSVLPLLGVRRFEAASFSRGLTRELRLLRSIRVVLRVPHPGVLPPGFSCGPRADVLPPRRDSQAAGGLQPLPQSLASGRLQAHGYAAEPARSGERLGLGLSFYAFQSLTYTIDLYRRDGEGTPSLLGYLAAASFFPTLQAGPITRVT